MADELPNAVALMRSPDFRDWVMAGSVYQARAVLSEPENTPDHPIRQRMAEDVITSPNVLVERLVNVIATDPEVASKGTTPQLVGQSLILSKIASVWTRFAQVWYNLL